MWILGSELKSSGEHTVLLTEADLELQVFLPHETMMIQGLRLTSNSLYS